MENSMRNDSRVVQLLSQIEKHPFLIAAFVCFACNWFGYCNQKFINGFMVYGVCVISIGCMAWGLYRLVRKGKLKTWAAYVILAAIICLHRFFAEKFMQMEQKAFVILVVGMFLTVLFYVYLIRKAPEKKHEIIVLCLAAFGFVLRYAYVLETDISMRQNDVGYLGDQEGHLAYICYFLETHHLPDFDPTTKWQFYHPPLHHIISAVWMKFCSSFGLEDYVPYEALQALPLFYSCIILIVSYKIMRLFRLKGKALYIPFAIICFFPYLIILSGALNNDALSICFIMGAVYNTMVWYREQRLGNILKIALCIGLGMMTKLSAGLIAPAVAVVFLYVLIKQRKTWWKVMQQYIVFGVICCPLGLWWGIRNYLKFGVPINYIATDVEGMAWQYLGDIPLIKRFTDFSLQQMKNPFAQWGYDSYLEYNPTIGMHKMAMFGEGTLQGDIIFLLAKILLWIGAVLAIACFLCFVISVFEKAEYRLEKIFMLIGYAAILGNFYMFCVNYAYTCTMNFRYVVPCMLIAAYGTGIWIQNRKTTSKCSKVLVNILAVGTVCFAVCVTVTYGAMIFTQQ